MCGWWRGRGGGIALEFFFLLLAAPVAPLPAVKREEKKAVQRVTVSAADALTVSALLSSLLASGHEILALRDA